MFYSTTLSGTTYEKGLLYALEKTKHKLDKVIVMVYDILISAFIIRIHFSFHQYAVAALQTRSSKHLVLMNMEHSVLAFQLNDLF